jgi:type II secretory pathway pseudopilin PulG
VVNKDVVRTVFMSPRVNAKRYSRRSNLTTIFTFLRANLSGVEEPSPYIGTKFADKWSVMKHLGNSNGQSLVQVLVSVGIMGILMAAMASMQTAQSRENRALDEKLGGLDLQRTMATALADGAVCKYMLQTPPINFSASQVLAGNPQTVTLTTPVYASVAAGIPGPVIVQPNTNPPRGTMPVKAITLTVASGSGTTFLGTINAVFDDTKLVRSIRPASATVILTTDVSNPGAATVTNCVGSNSSTCWELSGTNLYTTCVANVGIGTSVPVTSLQVNRYGQGPGRVAGFFGDTAPGTGVVGDGEIEIGHSLAPNDAIAVGYNNVGAYGYFAVFGGARIKFDAAGNMTATNFTPSDLRLKENIHGIDEALDKILNLRGVTFDWKNRKAGRQLGLIAQETESIFPEIVLTDRQGMKAVNYSALVAPMIEAIRELHRENTELHAYICQKDPQGAPCRLKPR